MNRNMKRYILYILPAMLLSASIGTSSAQELNSSYFLKGATYRHQLNPAFINESNYLSFPVFLLGNINIGAKANVGINDFLYKYNQNGYKLTTFMNPSVSSSEFLGNLHDNNKVNLNLRLTILSFGFRGWGGFNTFELGLRSNTGVNLPYGLFDFMKTGMSSEGVNHYVVKDLTVRSNNYVEASLGHARELIENKLSIGAKVKFLVGGANADARIRRMDISMSEDQWKIEAQGQIDGSLKGGYFTTKAPNEEGQREIDGFEIKSPNVGGFGVGFDLGAVYKLDDYVEGLTASAALLDLGFIRWNNGVKATMKNSYTFDGFKHPIAVDPEGGNDPGDIDNQLDQIGDDLEDFIKFYDNGTVSSRTTALAATMNIGAEYVLPCYKNLSFGLLSSTHFNKPFTWTEARLSANVAPLSWFEASVSYGVGTFGSSLGWVLNFHPKGFNFFIGTDHMITRVTPQYAPVGNANANVNLGFNITWGKNRRGARAKCPNKIILESDL